MDIKNYIPVGEANAVNATIVLVGGGTVTGDAWLESQSSAEVSVRGQSVVSTLSRYAVAVDHIAAVALAEPPPERS